MDVGAKGPGLACGRALAGPGAARGLAGTVQSRMTGRT
jgi:hypothetical protein